MSALDLAGVDRGRRLADELVEMPSLTPTSMNVFLTHTDQDAASSCKQNGDLAASPSSRSLAAYGEPSAVLSVAQLGDPHSSPRGDDRGDDPGEAQASGKSEPRGDDPGDVKAPGQSAAPAAGMGKKLSMGMAHSGMGMAHIPGGTAGLPCGLSCTCAAVTMVCPVPCTDKWHTSDKRASLIRSSTLTCPKAVSLSVRSKCT